MGPHMLEMKKFPILGKALQASTRRHSRFAMSQKRLLSLGRTSYIIRTWLNPTRWRWRWWQYGKHWPHDAEIQKSSEFGYVCWPSTSWSLSDSVLQFSFALCKVCSHRFASAAGREGWCNILRLLCSLWLFVHICLGGMVVVWHPSAPQKKSKMFLFTRNNVTYLLSSCFAWFEYE